MLPWLRERWANPSSPTHAGEQAADAVRASRTEVARLLGAPRAREVVFTSGGSEGIASAFWAAHRRHPDRPRMVLSAVEHSAVVRNAEVFGQRGLEIVTIPVDGEGRLDRERLMREIDERCALVSLMWANNETGVMTDLRGVADACRRHGVTYHLDAVQAPGKTPLNAPDSGADLITISGHKFHGPKGTGALWVRDGFPFEALVVGGPQEGEKRAGTENVPGIVGLGRAASLAREHARDADALDRLARLRDHLETGILERVPGTRAHGSGAPRVPNTTNVCFEGLEARSLLILLSEQGVEVAAGSACHATRSGPSPVLLAMGCSESDASSSLRFSLSRETTREELDLALEEVVRATGTLRSLA